MLKISGESDHPLRSYAEKDASKLQEICRFCNIQNYLNLIHQIQKYHSVSVILSHIYCKCMDTWHECFACGLRYNVKDY